MNVTSRSITLAATAALLALLSTAAPPAAAQAHEQASGDYVVRASTVSAENLPTAMRDRYDIRTPGNTAVLNVTVQRRTNGTLSNVPAQVQVRSRTLLGVENDIQMRSVVANDLISYMGTYSFLPREVLDFRVTAHPEGAPQPITLEFRDRLGRH